MEDFIAMEDFSEADLQAWMNDLRSQRQSEPEPVYCQRCGRKLRAARSIMSGRGPRCAAKIRRAVAVLAASRNKAANKAAELIEDGGLVRIRTHGGRVFRVTSSDGTARYITSADGCNCPAGLHEKLCYHRTAVTILTAA
jgi:Family of unknown function (DUF6011)